MTNAHVEVGADQTDLVLELALILADAELT
jgi:hypothetical protein